MKKRTIVLAMILLLGPTLTHQWLRHPGVPTVALGVPSVLAQTSSPAAGYDAAAASADPAAVEMAKARSRFHYLMLGYGMIWICLGVFLIDLTRKVDRVGSEIGELQHRLEATERGRRV